MEYGLSLMSFFGIGIIFGLLIMDTFRVRQIKDLRIRLINLESDFAKAKGTKPRDIDDIK